MPYAVDYSAAKLLAAGIVEWYSMQVRMPQPSEMPASEVGNEHRVEVLAAERDVRRSGEDSSLRIRGKQGGRPPLPADVVAKSVPLARWFS